MRRSIVWFTVIVMSLIWIGNAGAADSSAASKDRQGKTPSAVSQGAPSIRIPDDSYDFGQVMEGAEVAHEFTVKNEGNAVLQIDQVRPSWGCAVAHFDRAIPPGGEGKITLKLNLKGYQGIVKKTATVQSNDPQNGRIVLTMQGSVKSLFEVRPNSVISMRGMVKQISESVIDITATAGIPFHIKNVESNIGDKISYNLETVEEGKHYRLKVSNKVQQGNYSGYIKLFTDVAEKPEIILRVTAMIEGEISAKPQTILVGRLIPQQPVRIGRVVVTSNLGKQFQITKLIYDESLIRVAKEPIPNEQSYSLEITPVMENIPAGSRKQVRLAIETDLNPQEQIEVQVHVMNTADPGSTSSDASGNGPNADTESPGPPDPSGSPRDAGSKDAAE